MAFQEYPKALYRKGDYRSVADREDEEAARKEGFDDWRADHNRLTGAPVEQAKPDDSQKRATLSLAK